MRVVVVLAVLLAAGCFSSEMDTRPDPPPPSVEIRIGADGSYRLDGRVLTSEKLDVELTRRADEAPNPKLPRTMLHVVIRHAPGIGYDLVIEMQERCQRLGISQVEVPR